MQLSLFVSHKIGSAEGRQKRLPNNADRAATDGANGRHVLTGDLEQVTIHIVLNIATTMCGHSFDFSGMSTLC